MLHEIKDRKDLIRDLEDNYIIRMMEMANNGFPLAGTYEETDLVKRVKNFDTHYQYIDALESWRRWDEERKELTKIIGELEDKELASVLSSALNDTSALYPYFPQYVFSKNDNDEWYYPHTHSLNHSEINLYTSDIPVQNINRCIKALREVEKLASRITPPLRSGAVMSDATRAKFLPPSERYTRLSLNNASQNIAFEIDKILREVFNNRFGQTFLKCLIYRDQTVRFVDKNLSYYERPHFAVRLNNSITIDLLTV